MATCPLCGREMGKRTQVHICVKKYFREICPGKYQCMICGNIQDYSGPCAHCGMPLNNHGKGKYE